MEEKKKEEKEVEEEEEEKEALARCGEFQADERPCLNKKNGAAP